jgi:hypothetical protein
MRENEVQLVLRLTGGGELWVSISGVARFPDSGNETPEALLV